MTKIEWTEKTWNPVTGCTKVSQGCKHCYAERIADRFWGERKFTDVMCHPERLEIPLHWKKPRMIFVNSMSDLFHRDVPDEFIEKVWAIMKKCQRHTFQILTKRPERMSFFMNVDNLFYPPVLPNVWLGTSIEDQSTANIRLPWLVKTPAAVRFVSYEPALGPVDIKEMLNNIQWVIAGCESGPGARPAQADWFRSIRDQCAAAGVPFFLKQMVIDGKLAKMPELDGKQYAEYPR